MVRIFGIREKKEYIRIVILFILGFVCSIFVISYLSVELFIKEIFFILFMLIYAFVLLFMLRNRIRPKLSWKLIMIFFVFLMFNLVYMRFSLSEKIFSSIMMDAVFNITWILILELGIFISLHNLFMISSKRSVGKKKSVNKNPGKRNFEKGQVKTKGIKKVVRKSIRKDTRALEPKFRKAS